MLNIDIYSENKFYMLTFTYMKWTTGILLFLFGMNRAAADVPVADFSFYIEFVGIGADVFFLNESVDGETYFWDFGDGATSTDLHPFHHYDLPGIYTVCLETTNPDGSDNFCDTLITYYAPSADFSFSGDPTVMFTDMSTNFPTTWDWFFGDGDISADVNPTHTYLANGDYNACLSVGNPGGTNYTCKTVSITSYMTTVAAFTFSGDPTVNFIDNSTLDPFEWYWDFGDGTTSTEQNPVHTYTDNGAFNVCLTATNPGGSNTYCEEVSIIYAYPFPEADFDYLIIDLGVAFVDLSTNDPILWNWDFGDGEMSTEQNPIHVYPEDGSYLVCLTATNIGGPDTKCEELFIVAGVNDLAENKLVLFPNPAQELLFIQSQQPMNNLLFTIYDVTGKLILQQQSINGNLFQIDLTNLPSGIFSVLCTENGHLRYSGAFVHTN